MMTMMSHCLRCRYETTVGAYILSDDEDYELLSSGNRCANNTLITVIGLILYRCYDYIAEILKKNGFRLNTDC